MGPDHSGAGEEMTDVPGLQLKLVGTTRDEASFSVFVDGNNLGTVRLVKYYRPKAESLDSYIALWAGPTFCVIDREQCTIRCIDRDDETHCVHPYESTWIVEGELNIDLVEPHSGATLATYKHNEVITSSLVSNGLVHVEDFAGATVTLDPRHSFQVVRRGPISEKSDPRSH